MTQTTSPARTARALRLTEAGTCSVEVTVMHRDGAHFTVRYADGTLARLHRDYVSLTVPTAWQ